MPKKNEISIYNPQDESVIVYRSEDESVTLDVQLANETVWLTQKQMAWLFDKTPQNITIHLGNVYKEKELTREATCKDFLQVQQEDVTAAIYTQAITPQLKLDLKKHNAQYAPVDVQKFTRSHDRFLCIDDTVYHIGASLKDLGKKWFAFSKMEILTNELLNNMK